MGSAAFPGRDRRGHGAYARTLGEEVRLVIGGDIYFREHRIHLDAMKEPLDLLRALYRLSELGWFTRRHARALIALVCDAKGWDFGQ